MQFIRFLWLAVKKAHANMSKQNIKQNILLLISVKGIRDTYIRAINITCHQKVRIHHSSYNIKFLILYFLIISYIKNYLF